MNYFNHCDRAVDVSVLILLLLLAVSACANPPAETLTVANGFHITSAAFGEGETFTTRYSYAMGSQCSGENYSPLLGWSGAPAETESFAITVVDPDGGNWVLFNIYSKLRS